MLMTARALQRDSKASRTAAGIGREIDPSAGAGLALLETVRKYQERTIRARPAEFARRFRCASRPRTGAWR